MIEKNPNRFLLDRKYAVLASQENPSPGSVPRTFNNLPIILFGVTGSLYYAYGFDGSQLDSFNLDTSESGPEGAACNKDLYFNTLYGGFNTNLVRYDEETEIISSIYQQSSGFFVRSMVNVFTDNNTWLRGCQGNTTNWGTEFDFSGNVVSQITGGAGNVFDNATSGKACPAYAPGGIVYLMHRFSIDPNTDARYCISRWDTTQDPAALVWFHEFFGVSDAFSTTVNPYGVRNTFHCQAFRNGDVVYVSMKTPDMQKLDKDGNVIWTLTHGLDGVGQVDIDRAGNIYISDTDTQIIRKYTAGSQDTPPTLVWEWSLPNNGYVNYVITCMRTNGEDTLIITFVSDALIVLLSLDGVFIRDFAIPSTTRQFAVHPGNLALM